MHLVFVYGTLKDGEPNHSWLTDERNGRSRFVSNARTVQKYPLVIATKYNVPFLLCAPGVGHSVRGEVYEVDESVLGKLDVLEEHPDFYERDVRDVRADDGRVHRCWIYFLKAFGAELLRREMFAEYRSDGPHGLRYVERCLRDGDHDHRREVVRGETGA